MAKAQNRKGKLSHCKKNKRYEIKDLWVCGASSGGTRPFKKKRSQRRIQKQAA
jgi:hypothetical protein